MRRLANLLIVTLLGLALAGAGLFVVSPTLRSDVDGAIARATGGSGCRADRPCTRVLFIGNSYTYTNDLPATFATLARAGGHDVETGSVTKGGAFLSDLLAMPETAAVLTPGRWDWIVLQEQSSTPASASARSASMYPAIRSFGARIDAAASHPLLFLTWGHRDGAPDMGIGSYEAMQAAITQAYRTIGREQSMPIAPAGEAWAAVRRQLPQLALWQDDGSHPTAAGTYVAAATFYATIFREGAESAGFTGGLSGSDALTIRQVASATVLADPSKWYLP